MLMYQTNKSSINYSWVFKTWLPRATTYSLPTAHKYAIPPLQNLTPPQLLRGIQLSLPASLKMLLSI